jgi:hypothetical protein
MYLYLIALRLSIPYSNFIENRFFYVILHHINCVVISETICIYLRRKKMKKPVYVYDLNEEDRTTLEEQKLDPNDYLTVEVLSLNLQGVAQVATYHDQDANKQYPMIQGVLSFGLPIEQSKIQTTLLVPNQNPIQDAIPMPVYVKLIVSKEHLLSQVKKDYEENQNQQGDLIDDLIQSFKDIPEENDE